MTLARYEQLVEARLRQSGAEFEIHCHEPVRTMSDVDRLPFPGGSRLKTVVFVTGPQARMALVVVRERSRVDVSAVARTLFAAPDAVRLASARELEERLRATPGGIAPVPIDATTSTLFDTSTVSLGRVYCGAGRTDATLEIGIGDLIDLTGGQVARVALD
jgi:prolyl-tRNA editing enzyme YbaK/EbsC (Cys-tRNA(Pro) deacylase)